MDAREFLSALANELDLELNFDNDGFVDLSVSGRQVAVRYAEASDDWTYSTVVHARTESEPLSEALLRRALELSLMGVGTNRHSLGLFGEALILSGHAESDTLTPEAFFERLLLLVRTADGLETELTAGKEEAANPPVAPWSAETAALLRV